MIARLVRYVRLVASLVDRVTQWVRHEGTVRKEINVINPYSVYEYNISNLMWGKD